jgi:hypothetical protein
MEPTAKQQHIASIKDRNFSLPANFNSQANSMLLTRDSAQESTLSLIGFGFSPSIADLAWSHGSEVLSGAVAELVGNEGGVVSGVFNLESSGVEASDWRPRHDEHYHEA